MRMPNVRLRHSCFISIVSLQSDKITFGRFCKLLVEQLWFVLTVNKTLKEAFSSQFVDRSPCSTNKKLRKRGTSNMLLLQKALARDLYCFVCHFVKNLVVEQNEFCFKNLVLSEMTRKSPTDHQITWSSF